MEALLTSGFTGNGAIAVGFDAGVCAGVVCTGIGVYVGGGAALPQLDKASVATKAAATLSILTDIF
jgi:hypothetical protein